MQGTIPAGQPNAGAPDGVDVAAEVLEDVVINNNSSNNNVNTSSNKNRDSHENNSEKFGLDGWEHFIGPVLASFALPSPKRFVAKNSSQTSSIFSEAISKIFPKKINIKRGGETIRRLYTHTVNNSPRYAATWGRYIGRWGTRIGGAFGTGLMLYDFTIEVAQPMGIGMETYVKNIEDGTVEHVCFAKGTLVFTNEGFLPIEQINKGQQIYTFNLKTNEIELNYVTDTLKREINSSYELTTDNNYIVVTEEHPFYVVNKGWVKVKDIVLGDFLKTSTLDQEIVLKIEKQIKDLTVYNIEVSGNHNYFITKSAILVHNKEITK